MRQWLLGLLLVGGVTAGGYYVATNDRSDVPPASAGMAGWSYTRAVGHFHVHSLFSAPTAFADPVVKQLKAAELDHALSGDPTALLARAADNQLDFIAFADHGGNLTPGAWLLLGDKQQESRSPVALRGCEWTLGGALLDTESTDHLAVYGTTNYVDTAPWRTNWEGIIAPTLNVLYPWLDRQTDDWVGAFCHPWIGRSQFAAFDRPTEYPQLIRRLALIEVGGGENPYSQTDLAYGEKYYRQALGKGWRVAPIVGLDNFGGELPDNFVSVAWTRSGALTAAAILEAALTRRIYASIHRVPIDLRFAAAGPAGASAVMGGTLTVPRDATIRLAVRVATEKTADQLRTSLIELATDGTVLSRTNLTGQADTGAWAIDVRPTPQTLCYYVRMEFGAHVVALSAPIWVTRSTPSATARPTSPASPAASRPSPTPSPVDPLAERRAAILAEVPSFSPADYWYDLPIKRGRTQGYDFIIDTPAPVVVRVFDPDTGGLVFTHVGGYGRPVHATWWEAAAEPESRLFHLQILAKRPAGWTNVRYQQHDWMDHIVSRDVDGDYRQPTDVVWVPRFHAPPDNALVRKTLARYQNTYRYTRLLDR